MNTKVLLLGAGAAVAILAGVYGVTGGDFGGSKPSAPAQAEPEQLKAAESSTSATATSGSAGVGAPAHGVDTPAATALREKGYAIDDVVLGSAEAPVTIVEYASTTCPHCASFHNETLPELKKKYIETGKVRLIMREVYFNEPALWGSLVARCSGPEQYHAYMDVLFARLNDWAKGDGEQILGNLRQIGRLGGMSSERIEQCLNDSDLINFMVERYRVESEADGVRSTPHFIINGEVVNGAESLEKFVEVIDGKLAE